MIIRMWGRKIVLERTALPEHLGRYDDIEIGTIPENAYYDQADAIKIIDYINERVESADRATTTAERLRAALRMAREELVFGGDWATARRIVDETLEYGAS